MKLWKKLMKIKIIDRLKSNVMSITGRSTLYEYACSTASELKCSKYVIWNDHSNKIEYAECVFKSNEDFKWRVASSTFSLSSLCVYIHVEIQLGLPLTFDSLDFMIEIKAWCNWRFILVMLAHRFNDIITVMKLFSHHNLFNYSLPGSIHYHFIANLHSCAHKDIEAVSLSILW